MRAETTKWGYILDAPGRPTLAQQRETLHFLGVPVSQKERIFLDSIEKGSTRPQSQLKARNRLIEAMRPGDTLVVAGHFCLGVSGKDVAWFLPELARLGITLLISGGVEKIEPGDDVEATVKKVASAQNSFNSSKSSANAAVADPL